MQNHTQTQQGDSPDISARIEEELAVYAASEEFAHDMSWLENEYFLNKQPLPDVNTLRARTLEVQRSVIVRRIDCEINGHQITDHADPENGCGTLECEHCDFSQNYQW